MQAGKYTNKADVYSLGVIIWELMTGEEPWSDAVSIQAIERAVLSGRQLSTEGMPRGISSLLLQMWESHPSNRPTARKVVEALIAFQEREGLSGEEPATLNPVPASSRMPEMRQSAPEPTPVAPMSTGASPNVFYQSEPQVYMQTMPPPQVYNPNQAVASQQTSYYPQQTSYNPSAKISTYPSTMPSTYPSTMPYSANEGPQCGGLKRKWWIIIGASVGGVILLIIIIVIAVGSDDYDDDY